MKSKSIISATVAGVTTIAFAGCVDPDSPLIQESAEGCDEFSVGGDMSSLNVDAEVRTYLTAASDFSVAADNVAEAVFEACENIAVDLGAENTWSQLGDLDDAISNSNGTGACDAAGNRIEAILIEAEEVEARVAIAVSRGQCYPDFEAQARCEAECALGAACDSGTVETRCEPGSLSVMCEAACEAGAECIGTPDVPANCMGQCQAECQGECQGECIAEDGSVTEGDANCRGKCSSSCIGTCRGRCKVDAPEGVSCGASVRCTGGCTGEYTSPVCTTEFTPADCPVDADCLAACEAKVMANAPCDPTHVDVFAEIEGSPELQALVESLEAHLPALIDAAEQHGELLVNAAERLGDSGNRLSEQYEDLSGKSLACLGVATSAVSERVGMLNASVRASVDVTVTTTDRSE
jgi:hypothetical protein